MGRMETTWKTRNWSVSLIFQFPPLIAFQTKFSSGFPERLLGAPYSPRAEAERRCGMHSRDDIAPPHAVELCLYIPNSRSLDKRIAGSCRIQPRRGLLGRPPRRDRNGPGGMRTQLDRAELSSIMETRQRVKRNDAKMECTELCRSTKGESFTYTSLSMTLTDIDRFPRGTETQQWRHPISGYDRRHTHVLHPPRRIIIPRSLRLQPISLLRPA
jgi:hypothetical protein